MNPRNTLVLALVVAALGAFVWFYEIEGAEKRSEAERASKRLFAGVEAEAIDWIELVSEDGQNVRLERTGDEGWQLVAPLAFPADRFAADGIASTLAELEADATFDSPEPLSNYGLGGEPRIRFGVGDERFALQIGNDTPIGGNVYMTDADGARVRAVPSWRSNALKKTVKQLREAKILDFEPTQVNRVTVESAAGRVVLSRPEEAWRLTEPLDARADADAVDGLLTDLQFLRADEFVDDPASDAELGLDAPWLTIELIRDGEAAPLTLTVGAERDSNRIVRGSGAPVFEVAASRIESLSRELAAFRFKELARFTLDDAERFELHFLPPDGEPLTIDGTKDDDGWTTTPEGMQPGKASRLVSELSLLRAEEVMADALGEDELAALGLAPPRATLRVYGAETDAVPLADVRLGTLDPEHGIAAMRGDEPAVLWLGADLKEHLPIDRAAWDESFRAKPEPVAEPEVQTPAAEEPGEAEGEVPDAEEPPGEATE